MLCACACSTFILYAGMHTPCASHNHTRANEHTHTHEHAANDTAIHHTHQPRDFAAQAAQAAHARTHANTHTFTPHTEDSMNATCMLVCTCYAFA